MAIAMAAVEHSFLCQESTTCKEVAKMTRWDIPLLHTLNLLDVILESISLIALLLWKVEFLGQGKTGGPLLLGTLIVDFALECIALNIALNAQPTVRELKNSGCTDQVDADGSNMQETLINLENMLEDIVRVGYGELFLAVVAFAGDLHEQYRIHVMDDAYVQDLGDLKRIFFIFIPSVSDIALAVLDYFIFTTQAEADSERLRASIVSSVGTPTTWCLSLADDCLPIIEEDADRFNGRRPQDLNMADFLIPFLVSLVLLTLIYFGTVLYLKRTSLCKRLGPTNSKQDSGKSIVAPTAAAPTAAASTIAAPTAAAPTVTATKAATLDSFDQEEILAKAECIRLERLQVQRT